jgi:AAA+ superfamily predicted ATPase
MLGNYLNAAYPLLFIRGGDEAQAVAAAVAAANGGGYRVAFYSASGRYIDANGDESGATYPQAFALATREPGTVLICRDFAAVAAAAPMYRAALEAAPILKANGSALVFVGSAWRLPSELSTVAPVIDLPLPSRGELRRPLADVAAAAGLTLDEAEAEALLDAAAGLTLEAAENAFALSFAESGRLSAAIVAREKVRTIAATGFLSVEAPATLDDIGGLDNLKSYLADEVAPNVRDAALAVRGVLLCGLPGTGKSLTAKAAAAALGVPLVRLDVGACKGSLVGQSEANIRQATATVEAVAPCVLWLDEVEKALPSGGAGGDSGVSVGILGHLLTWLQEHNAAVFTVATCNNVGALPPELTRAGRFDERFFVDLPTLAERRAIAAVHLARFGGSIGLADAVADATADYTGAELAAAIKSAARRTGRKITAEALRQAVAEVRPLAKVDAEAVAEFRRRSRDVMRLANAEAEPQAQAAAPPRVRRVQAAPINPAAVW